MSPRKAAVLRDGDDGQDLREYLVNTAARLIGQRRGAGLTVRDIAREAKVADGVLYNYFEDKEDLLAHALLAHVGAVMAAAPPIPPAGARTVQENLRFFIDRGIALLTQVLPAFAGLLAQPKVLSRFHAMVGGDAGFSAAAIPEREHAGEGPAPASGNPAGLPASLKAYLRAEQHLGRIDAAADIEAAATLIVGAIHGEILPRVLFSPPGSAVSTPPGLAGRLAETILAGIEPGSGRQPRLG